VVASGLGKMFSLVTIDEFRIGACGKPYDVIVERTQREDALLYFSFRALTVLVYYRG